MRTKLFVKWSEKHQKGKKKKKENASQTVKTTTYSTTKHILQTALCNFLLDYIESVR